jgi:phosphohistidine phosphatase
MKTLILVRHAKSSWDSQVSSDFDRPLNDRGKEDAPEMARRLKDKNIKIDLFVSSTAKRARRTARYFAEAYDVKKDEIMLVDDLYLATQTAFISTVKSFEDKYETAALFSHNPGITEFASSLTNVRVDDMPTCAIFAVQADTDTWKEFLTSEKKFLFFDYPKNPLP